MPLITAWSELELGLGFISLYGGLTKLFIGNR